MKKYIDLVRVKLVREKLEPKLTICASGDAANILKEYLQDCDRETMVALLLDTKHNIQSICQISIGCLDGTICHPREIFKAAILANASCIILGHNHPSGDCTPSNEDVKCTRRTHDCGKLLGIPLLDHVIVGDNCFYSFYEQSEILK